MGGAGNNSCAKKQEWEGRQPLAFVALSTYSRVRNPKVGGDRLQFSSVGSFLAGHFNALRLHGSLMCYFSGRLNFRRASFVLLC